MPHSLLRGSTMNNAHMENTPQLPPDPRPEPQAIEEQQLRTPCGGCKFLRRSCKDDCIYAVCFPGHKMEFFEFVHSQYGASNVAGFLKKVPPEHRMATANTLVLDAHFFKKYPIRGATELHSQLCVEHNRLESNLNEAKACLQARLNRRERRRQQYAVMRERMRQPYAVMRQRMRRQYAVMRGRMRDQSAAVPIPPDHAMMQERMRQQSVTVAIPPDHAMMLPPPQDDHMLVVQVSPLEWQPPNVLQQQVSLQRPPLFQQQQSVAVPIPPDHAMMLPPPQSDHRLVVQVPQLEQQPQNVLQQQVHLQRPPLFQPPPPSLPPPPPPPRDYQMDELETIPPGSGINVEPRDDDADKFVLQFLDFSKGDSVEEDGCIMGMDES